MILFVFNYVVSIIIVAVLCCWITSLKLLWLNYVINIEVECDLRQFFFLFLMFSMILNYITQNIKTRLRLCNPV